MKNILLLLLLLFSTVFISCTVENDNILVDNCGKLPDKCEVTIGNQIWMCKNLDVDHYRNGDSIPEVRDATEWAALTTGAWCYYNNDEENGCIYGKLYNWYAVNDPRGLAPDGWHVASNDEWIELVDCLGGNDVAGGKLKESGIFHWLSPNTGATNESGFSGLPGGWRIDGGWGDYRFCDIEGAGIWWTSTAYITQDDVWHWNCRFNMSYLNASIMGWGSGNNDGFSVRCVKD